MEPIRDPEILARMRIAFDLYQAAEDMMRLNLQRRYPEASEAEIERHLLAWLAEQPESPRHSPFPPGGRPREPGE